MQVVQLARQLRTRVQTLGLVDPQTGFLDEEELEDYIGIAITYLTSRYQLQHFLNIDRELLRTEPDVETYAIPPNLGFWAPEQTRQSGLSIRTLDDDDSVTNLEYYDPARFNLYRTGTTGKPAWFTLANNLFWLQQVPDQVYVIEAIVRPSATLDIPEAYVPAVGIQTLYRLAADKNKLTPVLQDEHTQIIRTLVNNEARFRTRFYTSRERIGFGRGRRRRYGY